MQYDTNHRFNTAKLLYIRHVLSTELSTPTLVNVLCFTYSKLHTTKL